MATELGVKSLHFDHFGEYHDVIHWIDELLEGLADRDITHFIVNDVDYDGAGRAPPRHTEPFELAALFHGASQYTIQAVTNSTKEHERARTADHIILDDIQKRLAWMHDDYERRDENLPAAMRSRARLRERLAEKYRDHLLNFLGIVDESIDPLHGDAAAHPEKKYAIPESMRQNIHFMLHDITKSPLKPAHLTVCLSCHRSEGVGENLVKSTMEGGFIITKNPLAEAVVKKYGLKEHARIVMMNEVQPVTVYERPLPEEGESVVKPSYLGKRGLRRSRVHI
ncbi:MAG: hypothetical protein JW834_03230 [Candidatus Diapherotrites archaeon]|nr:hypothetical protein [Candidatus Diapherotrites archaeon]